MSKSFNSTVPTRIPPMSDSIDPRHMYNTLTGPYDAMASSKFEPSKLLHENEILRKRNFELELMVNRKLNELPDEIAIMQSENNHLKSLGHARLAEIEEWKRLLNQEKLQNKERLKSMMVDFERRFLEEVEKGVASKLMGYGKKIEALKDISTGLNQDNNYLSHELDKVADRGKYLLDQKNHEFENVLRTMLRDELKNQEAIYKENEAMLKHQLKEAVMNLEDADDELVRMRELLRKKDIEMVDALEEQKHEFAIRMRTELKHELTGIKHLNDMDMDELIARVQELENENEHLLDDLKGQKEVHEEQKRAMVEDFERRQDQLRGHLGNSKEEVVGDLKMRIDGERKIWDDEKSKMKDDFKRTLEDFKRKWKESTREGLRHELQNMKNHYEREYSPLEQENAALRKRLEAALREQQDLLDNQKRMRVTLIEEEKKIRRQFAEEEDKIMMSALNQNSVELKREKKRSKVKSQMIKDLMRENEKNRGMKERLEKEIRDLSRDWHNKVNSSQSKFNKPQQRHGSRSRSRSPGHDMSRLGPSQAPRGQGPDPNIVFSSFAPDKKNTIKNKLNPRIVISGPVQDFSSPLRAQADGSILQKDQMKLMKQEQRIKNLLANDSDDEGMPNMPVERSSLAKTADGNHIRFTEKETRPFVESKTVLVNNPDQRNSNFTFQQGDSEPTLNVRPSNESETGNFMDSKYSSLNNREPRRRY